MSMIQDITAPKLQTRIAGATSFEITSKDVAVLPEAARRLAPGTQVSVTALPTETESDMVAAAVALRREGLAAMPHVSARRMANRDALDRFIGSLVREAQVDRVFVIAGDLPAAQGSYSDALAVIRSGVLSSHGIRQVGISGYPEGHPAIDGKHLWSALQDKRKALRECGMGVEIITQFGFDADAMLDWVEQVRERGVDDLIRLGVPGPSSVKTLLKFATVCGVRSSASALAKYGLSLTRLLGNAGPDRLVERLEERFDRERHGEVALHLFPFGGLARSVEWSVSANAAVRNSME